MYDEDRPAGAPSPGVTVNRQVLRLPTEQPEIENRRNIK
jgi:hypothetical protein